MTERNSRDRDATLAERREVTASHQSPCTNLHENARLAAAKIVSTGRLVETETARPRKTNPIQTHARRSRMCGNVRKCARMCGNLRPIALRRLRNEPTVH